MNPNACSGSFPHESTRAVSKWVHVMIWGGFLIILLLIIFVPWGGRFPDATDLEFQVSAPAPETNAFIHFEKANALWIETPEPAWWPSKAERLKQNSKGQANSWDPKYTEEVLSANTAFFTEIEQGLACSHYRYVGPFDKTSQCLPCGVFREFCDAGKCSWMLGLKAKKLQLTGDFAGALAASCQQFRLGQMVARNASFLAEWHNGIRCQINALRRWEALVADARTPDSVLLAMQRNLEEWDQVAEINGFRGAVKGEYRQMPTAITMYLHDRYPFVRMIPYLYKPHMMMRPLTAQCRNLIANVDKPLALVDPNYPGKPKNTVQIGEGLLILVSPNSCGRMGLDELNARLEDQALPLYYLQTWIHSLHLKLALRRYEQKHGQLPDSLGDLAPEFLKVVPQDPYDGKPFRYSKQEKKIWAVGRDLLDQGGAQLQDLYNVDDTDILPIRLSYSKGGDLMLSLGCRDMTPTILTPDKQKKERASAP